MRKSPQRGRRLLDSSNLELVNDGSDQTVGMRFTAVGIPQGATILNAFVQFKVDEVGVPRQSPRC